MDQRVLGKDDAQWIARVLNKAGDPRQHMDELGGEMGLDTVFIETVKRQALNNQSLPFWELKSLVCEWISIGRPPRTLQDLTTVLQNVGLKHTADDIREESKVQSSSQGIPHLNSPFSFELPAVVNFKCRQINVQALHELISEQNNKRETIATAVTGLGGIGKSTLCVHYATEYFENGYQNVIWLNCETETTMTNSISRLVERLNVPVDVKSLGIPATLQHFCQQLKAGKTLIIFDNVDDTTKCHVPTTKMAADLSNHHYVLISSRSQEWNDYTNKLVLTLLSTNESVQFLSSYLTLTTADQTNLATHISTELQNLPLAIRQTGAYIKYKLEPTNIPLAGLTTCLNLLKSEPETILDYKYDCPTGDTYNKTICTTWGTTMVRIKGIDPLAVRIMKLASYFNSESIPFEIFCQLSPLPARSNRRFWAARFQTSGEKMRGSSVLGRDLVENALNCLTKYSMIGVEKETQTFEIHRLVQKVIRARVDRTQTYDILKEAIRLISIILRLKNYEDFEQICLAHAETIWAHFDKRGLAREEFLQEFRELIHFKMDTLDLR